MRIADRSSYLRAVCDILRAHWPENRTVNIVCHGHSVPAGYFATPVVDTMNAYPNLLHVGLKRRFPFSVINVIVTAIGGEDSESGAERFARDVLSLRPDVVTIDYALNDRRIGIARARDAWSTMIEAGVAAGAKVVLLTPTPDVTQSAWYDGDDRGQLPAHAEAIRTLAAEYSVALADSLTECMRRVAEGDVSDILSWSNHPNRTGHELVARELLRWFPPA
jgi:acyl-CoA thioesterase I